MLDPLSFSNKQKYLRTVTQFVILKKKILTNIRRPWSAFCDDLHEPQKNKNKSVGGETKIFWIWWKICGENRPFFILGCNLSYETSDSVFFIIFIIVQILTFFVKNKKNAQYCSLVVKLLLHLLKEKIDLVFDPPHPRPLPIFKFDFDSNRITCVEEQHYVRA